MRIAALAGFYIALLAGGGYLGHIIQELAGSELRTISKPSFEVMLVASTLVFALASALPFVPGAEIGFAMLVLLGGTYAPLVYLCMLAALSLAFLAGHLLSLAALSRVFGWLRFARAQALIDTMSTISPDTRLEMLMERAPRRWLPLLLKHRYLALVVLMNVPGNSVLGGGGGIALIAGMSGLFTPLRFIGAMALAVLPVPLLFLIFG